METLLGTKRGMTQIWTDEGQRLPVTVVDVTPNLVTEVRTLERDGYEAVQLGYGSIREKLVAKPQIGHFKKLGVGQRRHLREIRGPAGERKVGDELACTLFEVGTYVDVIGTSKGKGFQGTIKLHHFSRGPEAQLDWHAHASRPHAQGQAHGLDDGQRARHRAPPRDRVDRCRGQRDPDQGSGARQQRRAAAAAQEPAAAQAGDRMSADEAKPPRKPAKPSKAVKTASATRKAHPAAGSGTS